MANRKERIYGPGDIKPADLLAAIPPSVTDPVQGLMTQLLGQTIETLRRKQEAIIAYVCKELYHVDISKPGEEARVGCLPYDADPLYKEYYLDWHPELGADNKLICSVRYVYKPLEVSDTAREYSQKIHLEVQALIDIPFI